MCNNTNRPTWLKWTEHYVKLAASLATAIALIFLIRSDMNSSEQLEMMHNQWESEQKPFIYMPNLDWQSKDKGISVSSNIENVGLSLASNVTIEFVIKPKSFRSPDKDYLYSDTVIIQYLYPKKKTNVHLFNYEIEKNDTLLIKTRIDWTWTNQNVSDSIVYDHMIIIFADSVKCSSTYIDLNNISAYWGDFQL